MGTTGLAWLISEALAISKTHRETIHSSQEAMTFKVLLGRSGPPKTNMQKKILWYNIENTKTKGVINQNDRNRIFKTSMYAM